MGYLVETVLAPVWMWMIFFERPSALSLTGGGLIVATLLAHSLVELRGRRAQQRAS